MVKNNSDTRYLHSKRRIKLIGGKNLKIARRLLLVCNRCVQNAPVALILFFGAKYIGLSVKNLSEKKIHMVLSKQ